jgi:DNA-binding CsgD family transcriptional regulator
MHQQASQPEPCTEALLERAVACTRAAASMPAIATLDWCDRAACVLASIFLSPESESSQTVFGGVLLATVSPSGEVSRHEAAGVGLMGPPIGPHDSRQHEARGRLEGLMSLPWMSTHQSTPNAGPILIAGLLSSLSGPHWRETPSGLVWRSFRASEVLAGCIEVSPAVPGRSLICFAGVSRPSDSPPDRAPMATGIIELFRLMLIELAERATIALGQTELSKAAWISPREQQILDMLVLGHSVREIAVSLGRSPHTVHDHVKSLHRKLAAQSRGELVAKALGHGHHPGLTEQVVPDPQTARHLSELKPTTEGARAATEVFDWRGDARPVSNQPK